MYLRLHRQLRLLKHALGGLPRAGRAIINHVIGFDHSSAPLSGSLTQYTRLLPRRRLRLLEYAVINLSRSGHAIIDYILDYDRSDTPSSGLFTRIVTGYACSRRA